MGAGTEKFEKYARLPTSIWKQRDCPLRGRILGDSDTEGLSVEVYNSLIRKLGQDWHGFKCLYLVNC